MEIVEHFLKFERDNKLFDIKDKYGLNVWEAIRYCVGGQIIRNATMGFLINHEGHNSSVFFAMKRLTLFVLYSIRHFRSSILFILCSRDYKENTYQDAISDGMYKLVPPNDSFVIETTFNWCKDDYLYGNVCPSIFTLLLRLNRRKYDFSVIEDIVKRSYPNISFDIREWESLYKMFLTQYLFYNIFFKIIRIKKIVFVQNGIFKGLLAAAKKHNIVTIEMQHGQISKNHLMYSYDPSLLKEKYLYNPNYLLTFSPFWLKDGVLPGTQVVPIGNNTFYSVEFNFKKSFKSILVVSSVNHEDSLISIVSEILKIDSSFTVYYKLHPDEYNRVAFFNKVFSEHIEVKVVKDVPISALLNKVDVVLLVQSSVMTEALNAGVNVFVYRIKDYEVMDFLFEEEGVSFIDDAETFIKKYKDIGKVVINQGKYYVQFDSEKAKSVLF